MRCPPWSCWAIPPTWTLTVVVICITSSTQIVGTPRYSSRIVDTKSGAIRGIILELNSKHLEPVEVFRGVPYAAPPVGNLRLRHPRPPIPWSGTRLADVLAPVCPQKYPDVSNRSAALSDMPKGRYHYLKRLVPFLVNQSEDCLTLNIYVPGSGNRGLDAPYAVMVYIHGESFEWGSGNPYDGSVLASYGHIIFITVNYRLGILGFLKTRTTPPRPGVEPSGGNLALYDISAALKWIRDNIASFGGDPSRVTLLGHDTGAALANLLLLSSAGKGLLHRVILLSGTALSPWATIPDPDSIRESVSQQLACHLEPTMDPLDDDIAPCLRTKPLAALLDARVAAPRFMPRYGPFLDINTPDPTRAMERSSGTFISCELMLGATTMESYNDFSASDIQFGFEEDHRNRVLRTYVRNAYAYHLNEIFSAVRNEYTDWERPVQHPINIRDSTMEALSDGHTVSPLVRVGYLHARRGAKTYLFHFGYQSKDSDYPQRLGSVRGEDLSYVMGLPLVGGLPIFPQNYSRQDMGVAEAVLNFFTNFAKTGDPNEPKSPHKSDFGSVRENSRYRGITWDPYETGTQQYLSIAVKPKMKSHYRGHKMAMWLNLIPQLHQPGDEDVSMRHHHFREREEHNYAGVVRPESHRRVAPSPPSASVQGVRSASGTSTECVPDPTGLAGSSTTDELIDDEDEVELLQRLATRHYYSYTSALGITVGVGCLLLVLNMLIFAGIYYQRDRSKRTEATSSDANNSIGNEGTPLPHCTHNQQMPMASPRLVKPHEPPPCYPTLTKTHTNKIQNNPEEMNNTHTLPHQHRDRHHVVTIGEDSHHPPMPPVPPVRTSSNPPAHGGAQNGEQLSPPADVISELSGTIKKRVQIQEISV